MKKTAFLVIFFCLITAFNQVSAQNIYSLDEPNLYVNCENKIYLYSDKGKLSYNHYTEGISIDTTREKNVYLISSYNRSEVPMELNGKEYNLKFNKIPNPVTFLAYESDKNTRISLKDDLLLKKDKNIVITCKADALFASKCPKDAQFEVTSAEVIFYTGGRQVKVLKVKNVLNMDDFKEVKKGYGIQVIVKSITRTDFRGDKKDFKISDNYNMINSFYVEGFE